MSKIDDHSEYSPEQTSIPGMRRRDFFKVMGGGLYVFFNVGTALDILAAESGEPRKLPTDYNAFLLIHEDGKVSLFTGKIEMGQGIISSLPQMLADELQVAYESVKMVMGDTGLCPWDGGTWGSMSTRFFGPPLRAAAAEAKNILMQMAAQDLGIAVDQLEVKDGVVFSKADKNKKVTYAQLTKGKKIERYLDQKPVVKDYSEFRVMGKSFNHQDGLQKVTGAAKYTADVRLPGMLCARILRPPSHGAKLVSVDTSEAEKKEGVQVVRDGDLVAALHENPEIAQWALDTMKAEYSFNEMDVDDKTIFKHLLEVASDGKTFHSDGDVEEGRKLSEIITESEFYNSYVAHSPIEPHAALAQVEDDKITIWVSTQTPFREQDSIAKYFKLPIENVRIIPPFLGGGFGGKTEPQQSIEAVRLAKMVKKPVLVSWTRDEEFFYDAFRPAAVVKIKAGTDASGNIKFWDYGEYFAGRRGSDTIYDVPHQKTTEFGDRITEGKSVSKAHPFATGAWRGPGNNTNTFARESQIDIMASKVGMDPIEFRLKNLKDKRMLEVLQTAAEKAGWKPAKSPSGRGFGVACAVDAGAYVVHIAEIDVDKQTGKVQVKRIVCVQDMGFCINPQGATIQMEGCINMGMGYALGEEIKFKGGKIETRALSNYELPRFSWIPKIETYILEKNQPPQGGGEPAIIGMGAVLANAVFDATGARLYQLPMTPERILEAMKKMG